jgi:hypothetical protein
MKSNPKKGGVYQLPRKNCGKKYTGQTGRSLKKLENPFCYLEKTIIIPNFLSMSWKVTLLSVKLMTL